MALFTKSMAELKEAFVQARLAEDQHFGHRHIEQWLRRQYRVGHIVHPEQWNRCFCRDAVLFAAAGRELEVLRQFAGSSAAIPRGPEEYADEVKHRKRIAPLLEAIACANAEIYYGDVHGLIVVVGGSKPDASAFVFAEEHDANGKKFTAIKPLHSISVMDAVFATWKRGGPKAEAARTFLCDTVAGLIRKDRAEAEADFDQAVAVSADGKEIVHADWVVVVEDSASHGHFLKWTGRATAFAGETFRANKIRRACWFDRRHSLAEPVSNPVKADEIARRERLSVGVKQRLIIVPRKFAEPRSMPVEKWRILLTIRSPCPDPFPEGGVEFPTETS